MPSPRSWPETLLAWRHPGFSAHVGEAIPFEDKKAIEDVACYMPPRRGVVRVPVDDEGREILAG